MTGFGMAKQRSSFGEFVVEIASLNRKHLETNLFLPKELFRFEHEVRKLVGEKIERGGVTVRIQLSSASTLLPDLSLLEELKKGWIERARLLGLDPSSITLPFLVEQIRGLPHPELTQLEDSSSLQEGVRKALGELVSMKEQEGLSLKDDLQERLQALQQILLALRPLTSQLGEKMKEKWSLKIKELFSLEDIDKIYREAALLSEKCDVSEELVRLASHIGQFETFLEERALSKGRKLEFLLQEMGREINTIGSKSLDSEISTLIVEAKSVLEKMREQVQNIE